MRILRIYHAGVLDEHRQRERVLARTHGHDIHLICPPAWPEGGSLVRAAREDAFPVHIVGVHGRRAPNLFAYHAKTLSRVIAEVDPDIIDLHEEPYSLAAGGVVWALWKLRSRAKLCVYTAQNLDRSYPPPFSVIERLTLKRAAAAYPCSTDAGRRLRAHAFAGTVEVVPLGVTIPERRESGFASLRVGFVGRLEPYKGPMIALRAFAAANPHASMTMEVIGDGSQRVELMAESERRGIGERVTFTGALPQADTLARMANLDVLLVPSLATRVWKEQFGRVAAEAMAHSAAVIASRSGSLPEVVGEAGVLVAEGDQAAFSDALIVLSTSPEVLADLRRRGYERAADHFSWNAVGGAMDHMYRAIYPE